MNAVEYILQNVDAKIILDHYGFKISTENDGLIRSNCAIHGGDNETAFVWNTNNNLWYCYTGECGGGDVFTLIEKMENCTFAQSIKIVAGILGLDISCMTMTRKRNVILEDNRKWLDSMGKKKTQIDRKDDSIYCLPYTNYYYDESFDRFDKDLLLFFHSNFCKLYPSTMGLLYNKLVIPIYFKERLEGVALRDTTGTFQPKWMYDPQHWKISHILYNYDNALEHIKKYKESNIILVEGIFDVWSYHAIGIYNVVAIFGSSLSKTQGNLLLNTGLEWILSFDNDNAGVKCTKKVLEQYGLKADIKIITLPEGKDPGDCTNEELMQSYLSRN